MVLNRKTAFYGGCLFFVAVATIVYFANVKSSRPTVEERSIQEKVVTYEDDKPKFGFNDIFSSKFSYRSLTPSWISGNEYIFMDSSRNIIVREINGTNTTDTTLMPGSFYNDNRARSYKVSSDLKYVLLLTNYVKGWRHSYNGTYLVYDATANNLLPSGTLPDDVQYITWAPKDNALAYVKGFDIFYRSSVSATDQQLTNTGRANYIYNGIPDWVYEEEMISSNNVMYFSPDGSALAYAQFDDSQCDHIEFIRYDEKQYPQLVDVSYPKAGTTQPTNKVFIYEIIANETLEVPAPAELSKNDYLFNRVTWASPTQAAVMWCNREQTWSMMSMCNLDAGVWTCSKHNHEHKVAGGWLYQRRPYWIPVFGQNETEFFKVLPNAGWQHLALVNDNGVEFLTSGEYTVTSSSASYPSIELYDRKSDHVYFLATIEDPGKRQVYRVKGHEPSYPQCVTCTFATQYPGRCDYVTAIFSTDGSHVVVRCRGEGPPVYAQFTVDHMAAVNEALKDEVILEENAALVDAVSSTIMSSVQYGTFKSTTSNYEFHYRQWNPPNMDPNKQYPLLLDVYAGPGYQNVDYYWTRSWAPAFVPVGLEAIVVRVDGRGSNFYGDKFMHEVYKQLGQKEVEDQIEAAKYFGNLPYVDKNRIAIWGWSYGGFASSHAVGLGTDYIKCGLAVAPLTDWRYYDTIYAERYMGDPNVNVDGYDSASVMNKAANFNKASYYLIHGMTDDNVHFQNAAQLEKELVDHDINFKSFFYADQDHSINSGRAYYHVYRLLTKYLCECFDIDVPADVWPQ